MFHPKAYARAAEEDDHSGGSSAGPEDPDGLLGCVDLFLWTEGLAGDFAGGIRHPFRFCFFSVSFRAVLLEISPGGVNFRLPFFFVCLFLLSLPGSPP